MKTNVLLGMAVGMVALSGVPARAQGIELTLRAATERAMANNRDIQIVRESAEASEAQRTSALGAFDLQLRLDVEGHHHRDPITTLFSGAPPGEVAASQSDVTSTASVTQLFRTGAIATASASAARQTTDSVFTLFVPAYVTSLGVDFRQPLMRGRTVDAARNSLRVTALDRDRSAAALEQQVLDVVAAVEKAYWALVSARREVDVRRNSVTLADQQRADTDIRIQARTVAVADLAQPTAEVERRRGDLLAAQEAAARADRALKLLILGDPADPWWTQELVPSDGPEIPVTPVDLPRALSDATRHRPELTALAADVSTREAQVALAADSLRPQVDLVASYAARGLAGDRNPDTIAFPGVSPTLPEVLAGGAFTSLHTLVDSRFPNASLGVSVAVPIGRHAARGDLAAAEAQRRQAALRLAQMRDQISVDVRNAVTALETAASRIQAARASLAAANVQLTAEQERFAAGVSTNFFVLTRQTDLALAQLSEISALVDYRRALTDVGRATGTLLADRGITFTAPPAAAGNPGSR